MNHYFVATSDVYFTHRYSRLSQYWRGEGGLLPWIGVALFLHLVLLAILPRLPQNPIAPSSPMLVSLMRLPAKVLQLPTPAQIKPQPEVVRTTPKKLEKSVQTVRPVMTTTAPSPEIAPTPERSKPDTSLASTETAQAQAHAEEKVVATNAEPANHVEEKIEPPKFGVAYLNNPAPEYPSLSRRKGDEGRVLLKVRVSAEGKPDDVKIEKSSGFDLLDEAALNTVKQWRFVPAHKGDVPLSAEVIVPIKFALKG